MAVFAIAIGIGLLGYPVLLGGLLARLGVRGSCAVLLLLSIVSVALGARSRSSVGIGVWPGLAIVGVLLAGVVSGDRSALLLVPAIVYLGLADLFRRSLDRDDSIIERGARWAVPEAPEFIRSYCRAVTWLWVALFAASALAITALALAGPEALWQAATGWGIYSAMLLVCGLEFFVRKTWFRYYFHGGSFDRLWSRLFPAENTARGRRSAEHIRRFREEAAQATRARG